MLREQISMLSTNKVILMMNSDPRSQIMIKSRQQVSFTVVLPNLSESSLAMRASPAKMMRTVKSGR